MAESKLTTIVEEKGAKQAAQAIGDVGKSVESVQAAGGKLQPKLDDLGKAPTTLPEP